MSHITIDFIGPTESAPRERVETFFWRGQAHWVRPVVGVDAESGVPDVLPSEGRATDSDATTFEGPGCMSDVLQCIGGPRQRFWCALDLPLPTSRGPARGPYLRRVAGHEAVLTPLCELILNPDKISLRFSAFGCPLVAPPKSSLDWSSVVAHARRELRGSIEALPDHRVVVGGGAGPLVLRQLADSLGPRVEVRGPSEVVGRPSMSAGPCLGCRHANHGTVDLAQDGLLACSLAGSRLGRATSCDVTLAGKSRPRFAYEPFDGLNGTWGAGVPLRFSD